MRKLNYPLQVHSVWPVVIFGARTPEALYRHDGLAYVLSKDSLYGSDVLARSARLYEGAPVFADHKEGGVADFNPDGSPNKPQVGWIVSPYWHQGMNEVRGYLYATGLLQPTLLELEAAGRLSEQRLSQRVLIDCAQVPLEGRRVDVVRYPYDHVDVVNRIRRVISVDLVPAKYKPASGGRFLERHSFPELVHIAEGRAEEAKRVRMAEARHHQAANVQRRVEQAISDHLDATLAPRPPKRERFFFSEMTIDNLIR